MAIYLGNTLLTGPSGGTGDAVLADDQTFTGQNTFTDTTIFNNTTAGINVDTITGVTNTNTFIETNSQFVNGMRIDTSGIRYVDMYTLPGFTNNLVFNGGSVAIDYTFAAGTKNWLTYQDSSDTLTVDADNLVGVAGSESGFWTPTWNNIGTIAGINTRYTYSRVGQTVTLKGEVFVSAGTSTSMISILASSLPYTVQIDTNNVSSGTFYTSSVALNTPNLNAISFTGVVLQISGSLYFVDSRTNNTLAGTNPNGFLGFTVTYITSD